MRIIRLAALVFLPMGSLALRADDPPATPAGGFDGARYAPLWTKSPFAIATPDAPVASTDYQLVGVARFDGVSYASVVEKQSNEHFVLVSNKPVKNLTLVSVSPGSGTEKTRVVIQRDGQPLTLELDPAAAPLPAASSPVGQVNPPLNAPPMPQPGTIPPNGISSVGGVPYQNPGSVPPRPRFHRPLTHVPPPPPPPQ